MERIAIILLAVFVAAYAKEISNFNKREDGETSLLHERGFSEAVEAGEMKKIQRRYDSSTGILDTADKKEILDKHNEHRAAASPTASNMKKMKWSTELEGVAQAWADQCNWSHNDDRSSNSPSFGYVGENKYLSSGRPAASRPVDYWHLESSKYDYDTRACSSGICTHYTQVMWHDSEYVGCATRICSSMVGLSGWNDVWYAVCNYGPGGNYNGQDPYTSGTACDDCSDDTTCEDDLCAGLCGM